MELRRKLLNYLSGLFKKKNSDELSYYKLSVTGGREVNQDECIVLKLGESSWFLAVADGMGGAANGYIASNIAINIAFDILENDLKDKLNINLDQLKRILKSVYQKIQSVIKEQIVKNPDLKGMGTTLTCLLIYEGKYVWGNIGDSRIIKIKDNDLIQLTEDHNYITDYKKENMGSLPSEIKNSYSHLLTKCLDGGDDQPDIFPFEKDFEMLDDNELFLLCSDGLLLNNYKFKKSNSSIGYEYLKKTGQELIANSFKEGSTDNITLIMYRSNRK